MVFRTNKMQNVNQDFLIKIGDQSVERIGNDCNTKSFKFVGVHLDEHLTWEKHTVLRYIVHIQTFYLIFGSKIRSRSRPISVFRTICSSTDNAQ